MCLIDQDPEWYILAPRVRKVHRLSTRSRYFGVDLQKVLFNDENPWGAWSKLAKPAALLRKPVSPIMGGGRGNALSRLELLPTELISLILADPALERSDVIALGLTSKMLWLHVLQHIEKDCWLAMAPLSGVELATAWRYLSDLPESFKNVGSAESSGQIWGAGQVNYHVISSYAAVNVDSEEAWRAAFKLHNARATGIPATLRAKMVVEMLSSCAACWGSSLDATWVLRNLTTKEYVHCRPGSGPKERLGYVDHPDAAQLRVDDVLLLRIFWIQLLPWEYRYPAEPGLRRGAWAGHRFDIVPLNQAGVLAVGGGWKDSTDEVVKEAIAEAEKIPQCRLSLTQPPRKRRRMLVKAKADGLRPHQAELVR